ncbi:MAG TPA: prepilin-type N-terminal cleavage/methylation domain-containing protein [Phycisphaerae bacterium]|nr:prepilin-type N-terminal cleavage/methylation domain-containing protein [Phycisphaerae bacterium]
MHARDESIADGASRPARARPRCCRAAGVTLIELLAVVVVLGLMAAIALPRLADANLWMAEGEAGVRKVVATARLARRMAIENAADNSTGYALVCTQRSYRVLNTRNWTYGEETVLADGWQFDRSDYVLLFDPYGGAHRGGGLTGDMIIRKDEKRWAVHIEPATGHVWCEQKEES